MIIKLSYFTYRLYNLSIYISQVTGKYIYTHIYKYTGGCRGIIILQGRANLVSVIYNTTKYTYTHTHTSHLLFIWNKQTYIIPGLYAQPFFLINLIHCGEGG